MRSQTVTYILAAVIVLILGAFSGWYFFLKTQSQTTALKDVARGYVAPLGKLDPRGATQNVFTPQTSPPAKSGSGFFSRLLSSITGGGTGVSDPTSSGALTSGVSEFSNLSAASSTIIVGESSIPAIKRPPQLSHIHSKPIAGMTFTKIAGNERLRYVERSSGYLFEANPETATTIRVTNTLTPKIHEALFTTDGRIIQRSLSDAGNIVTTIGSTSTSAGSAPDASSTALSSIALIQNIAHITSDPKTGALFYLVNETPGAVGIRSEWNGGKQKRIFTSVIPHWRSQWLSDGRIILTQAASDDIPGYAYEMKSDGTLAPLVRSVPGLTILPRAGGALLYGQSSGGALALFARVRADATAIRLPIRTIADKCVWKSGKDLIAYCGVPQGITARYFLDDWYRGATHSSDALWRIDASAGTAEVVYTPETDISIDMENLTINSAGTHIAFMNAADKSLWLLRIEE